MQTEVTTIVCGEKEFQKLVQIGRQLDTVKQVIHIEEKGVITDVSTAERNTNWKIISFDEVKKLGRENPVEAQLPVSADIAVIMYTSGSTGLPKVFLRPQKLLVSEIFCS